ncbi:MAG: proline--tRNA ligase [Candidatus Aenigmatarchaeota archaeon]|nr:MAG: proline--tRNA ligase [Candidatus Aenigmarchaeota archaeon]
MSEQLGMQHKKSEFSEWYNEIVQKAELADHSSVSGCMVIRPYAHAIWERIQRALDDRFKARGVQNTYFPMFIPESLLKKESEHIEGFAPEVAWVTHSGETKLGERLAVRPTSETIMYESFAKWIRSWRDLPLKINQWCNIVRWEFKHPMLFLRTREFLWQEGHTAFADKETAKRDVEDAREDYRAVYEDLMAVPVVSGLKSEKEKFAGAEYTTTLEIMMPDGWVIQGCTSHHLGQNFSRPFGITFKDKDEKDQHVYQNSWGFTTRSMGILFATHGDDKGLIVPPRVAPVQAVIVPIYKDENKTEVLKYAHEISEKLPGLRVHVDDRDAYTPGFKFNWWELRGVPLRIECGPRDMASKEAVFVRRDDGKKTAVKLTGLREKAEAALEEIQKSLYSKAKKFADEHTKEASNMTELKKHLDGNRIRALWCGSRTCEDGVREETGAKISCLPYGLNTKPVKGECVYCGKGASHAAYFGRSY